MTEDKKVSTTKLLVIDTKALKTLSYVGNERGGEADLPDPNGEQDFTAKELIPQLNAFREDADAAIYRRKQEEEKQAEVAKKLKAATEEYSTWFNLLVKTNEPS